MKQDGKRHGFNRRRSAARTHVVADASWDGDGDRTSSVAFLTCVTGGEEDREEEPDASRHGSAGCREMQAVALLSRREESTAAWDATPVAYAPLARLRCC